MQKLIPEPNKKRGVCYAFSDSGLELPIIDITHQAFHQEQSEEQLFAGARRYARAEMFKSGLERWTQRTILPFFLRRSIIGRGLLRSREGYLDGMSTYLLKLGPQNLGSAYAGNFDRKLAAGLNGAGMSLGQRVQDMAETLAAGLRPLLKAEPGRPLHLVNIAGGPSMDSLNALILLYKEDPSLFAQRSVQIHVLDLEMEGPLFARTALDALQSADGPLRGLRASLLLQSYDWHNPVPLGELLKSLPHEALVGASSEGGLFDYGHDQAVLANLRTLRACSPADTVLAASISRPDDAAGFYKRTPLADLVLRSLEDLGALAGQAGWQVSGNLSRPMNFVVGLKKL